MARVQKRGSTEQWDTWHPANFIFPSLRSLGSSPILSDPLRCSPTLQNAPRFERNDISSPFFRSFLTRVWRRLRSLIFLFLETQDPTSAFSANASRRSPSERGTRKAESYPRPISARNRLAAMVVASRRIRPRHASRSKGLHTRDSAFRENCRKLLIPPRRCACPRQTAGTRASAELYRLQHGTSNSRVDWRMKASESWGK